MRRLILKEAIPNRRYVINSYVKDFSYSINEDASLDLLVTFSTLSKYRYLDVPMSIIDKLYNNRRSDNFNSIIRKEIIGNSNIKFKRISDSKWSSLTGYTDDKNKRKVHIFIKPGTKILKRKDNKVLVYPAYIMRESDLGNIVNEYDIVNAPVTRIWISDKVKIL